MLLNILLAGDLLFFKLLKMSGGIKVIFYIEHILEHIFSTFGFSWQATLAMQQWVNQVTIWPCA